MYAYSFVIFFLLIVRQILAQNLSSYIANVKNCLTGFDSLVCLKEETLDILNRTIYSDESISLFDSIDIVRDKEYKPQIIELPSDVSQRSIVLTGAIYDKIIEFFRSRVIQFRTSNSFEARKKGGGGFGGGGGKKGGGGMIILVGAAMAGMLAQLFMGKIALAAGAALLLSKVALLLSLISGFKKSSGDSGGKESAHVVYATGGGDPYGHGHGGWHRSLTPEENPQQSAYNGYLQHNPYS